MVGRTPPEPVDEAPTHVVSHKHQPNEVRDPRMSSLEDRITELETKVSFLELANQQMSDLIYAQQQQLDAYILTINAKLESFDNDNPSTSLLDEVPPHY